MYSLMYIFEEDFISIKMKDIPPVELNSKLEHGCVNMRMIILWAKHNIFNKIFYTKHHNFVDFIFN